MAVDVTTEILIDRPIEVVADYAADPEKAPIWYDNIASAAWRSEPPLRVGSKVDFTAKFLGRRLAYTYEITTYEPRRLLVMRTHQGPFPMETTYTWTAERPGTTKMTLRNRGEPTGFSKMLSSLMVPAMRRANRRDLEKLRDLLQAS